MSLKNSYQIQNIKGRPGRSAILICLVAFMALALFSGMMMTQSLKNGLNSFKERLGAEIMVVPSDAAAGGKLEDIVLQGNTGYFYMGKEIYEDLCALEGVAEITPQYFLASTTASCCSAKLQLIGFDPETDFVITPWIQKSTTNELGENQVVVGNSINAFVGDTLTFFGVECSIVAKLSETGTSYDNSIFMSSSTIENLIESSVARGLNIYGDISPDDVVSCVLINTDDNTDAYELADYINENFDGVTAVRTDSIVREVLSNLEGVSGIVTAVVVIIWVFAVVITALVFTLSQKRRAKEFAVLRILGASRKKLVSTVLSEALILSLIGALIGVVLGGLICLSFTKTFEEALGLPYLNPNVAAVVLIALISIVLSVISGTLAAGISAGRVTKLDISKILRSKN